MKSINEMKKEISSKIKRHDIKQDEDGNYIINATIYDDSNFLSPYTSDNEEMISEETATFLEQSSKIVPPKANLHIKIYSNEIDDREQEVYKKAIKKYYLHQIIDINRKLVFNSLISAIFTIVGLATFLILLLLESKIPSDVIYEVFSIFGWVFLWEAVDQIFIERYYLNRQRYRYYNLYFTKITYEKIKN